MRLASIDCNLLHLMRLSSHIHWVMLIANADNWDKKYRSECDIRIDFDTNEYPNIFVSRKQYERISEYIRIKRNDTNMIRINIRIENDTNIRIFKYSSHSNRV